MPPDYETLLRLMRARRSIRRFRPDPVPTGPLVAAAELRRLLRVPAGWDLAALVPLGFAAESPAAPPRRALARLWQRARGTDERREPA
jgi:hypothetical protein